MVPRLVAVLLAPSIATALACGPRHARGPASAPTACVALPGTSRASLRLSPDGASLYWHERVAFYGYRKSWPSAVLARWDLDAAPPRPLAATLGAPFRVLDDGAVVGVGDGGVVLWRDGVSELISDHASIGHLELLVPAEDAPPVAVYQAVGAVWLQPLRRVTARRLAAADALVGLDGAAVVLWRDDRLIAHDVASGAERTLPEPDGELIKVLDGSMIVRRPDGLALQPLAGGPARVVLPGGWVARPGPDGVRATRRDGDRVEAAMITAAGVDRLPGVRGATDLVGFVRLPDRRAAYLVGHDVDGDGEITSSDEDDLCIGAADRPLVVTPRRVPRRFAAAAAALDRLAAELGTSGYRFAATGEVPGLTFVGGDRRHDRARRWRDVGRAAEAAAAAVGDVTLSVSIEYADGGRALSEWDTSTGKRVRWAGTGGALVPDPDGYEIDVTPDTLVRADDGTVTCIGSLVNRTDRALSGLAVDCVGGENDTAIPVFPTTVPPGQVARFSGTTTADRGGVLLPTVHRPASGEAFLTYDRDRVARYERIAAAAAEVVDRSRLTVWDWSGGAEVGVELWAPDDFLDYSDAARQVAAEIAYEVLSGVDRRAFLGEPDAALALTIHAGGEVWSFDGKVLSAGAP